MGKQRISIMSFNLPLHLFSLCRFHFKTSIASCIKQIDASAVHEFEPCYVQLCSATEVQLKKIRYSDLSTDLMGVSITDFVGYSYLKLT